MKVENEFNVITEALQVARELRQKCEDDEKRNTFLYEKHLLEEFLKGIPHVVFSDNNGKCEASVAGVVFSANGRLVRCIVAEHKKIRSFFGILKVRNVVTEVTGYAPRSLAWVFDTHQQALLFEETSKNQNS
jgi:hypothetical protein